MRMQCARLVSSPPVTPTKTWCVLRAHADCDVRCQMRPYHMLYESVRSGVRTCARDAQCCIAGRAQVKVIARIAMPPHAENWLDAAPVQW